MAIYQLSKHATSQCWSKSCHLHSPMACRIEELAVPWSASKDQTCWDCWEIRHVYSPPSHWRSCKNCRNLCGQKEFGAHGASCRISDNSTTSLPRMFQNLFFFSPPVRWGFVRCCVSCPAASSASCSSTSSAGPQLQALHRSVPRRTRTANPGSECSPPDLDHKESSKI